MFLGLIYIIVTKDKMNFNSYGSNDAKKYGISAIPCTLPI
jgi:hypothetical protein